MQHTLIINSSPSTLGSVSRELTALFEKRLAEAGDFTITHRDIGANPPPHLDMGTIGAFFTPPEQQNADQEAAIALSNELVDELLASDLVVVGAPMHNFGIPSGLKAYIDHIVRAGRTFSFSESGAEGLVKGKKLMVLTARGNEYSSDFMRPFDMQENYLRTIFGFIGVTDVEFIHCESTAISDEARAASVKTASRKVAESVARLAA